MWWWTQWCDTGPRWRKRERGGQDISRREVQYHGAFFYMDDGLVAPTDPEWLQGAFDTLVGMFDRVGLRTNVGNMVGMVFRPCQTAGTQSEAAY